MILYLYLFPLSHFPEDINPALVNWEPWCGPKPDLQSSLHCYKWCSKILSAKNGVDLICWFAYFSVWMPSFLQTLKFQVQNSINAGLTFYIFIKTLPSAAFLRDAVSVCPWGEVAVRQSHQTACSCLWKRRENCQFEKFLTFFNSSPK